jgi:hypothetical protein
MEASKGWMGEVSRDRRQWIPSSARDCESLRGEMSHMVNGSLSPLSPLFVFYVFSSSVASETKKRC